jgi:hypothetical protein
MKKSLIAVCIAFLANVAVAAPDPAYCGMVAAMAKSITADRDRGVAYKAELGMLKGATEGEKNMASIYKVASNIARVVYKEMPNLTPEGAYNLHYVVCMGQK